MTYTIKMSLIRVRTQYVSSLLEKGLADELFLYLRDNIEWENSIYSSKAKSVTRKGKNINFLEDEQLLPVILLATETFQVAIRNVLGVYLNYYRDGKDFAPQHTHRDTTQIVISLGCPRTLNVGKSSKPSKVSVYCDYRIECNEHPIKKNYIMQHGDAVLFGASLHGVVPDANCKEERISIALFCRK